jgi:hypothetical protein
LSDLYIEKYSSQKDYFSESDILRMVQVISDLRQQLKEGAEPRIFLEMALVRLARMDTTATLTDVLKKLSSISSSQTPSIPPKDLFNGAQGKASSAPEKKSLKLNRPDTSQAANLSDSTTRTGSGWQDFLSGYTRINGMLSMMLKRGQADFINDGLLQLKLPADSGIDTLLTCDKVKQIEMELQKYFGRFVKFRVETDPAMKLDEPRMTLDPRFDYSPEDLFKKNPEIREIVDRYDGKITSIKKTHTRGVDNG